ncbi:simple sugar transport system ATP-binding protein [Actinobaculum suis]|uniref:ABC transporter ATP-binding protein n=1 Tax=Actinobaculum suis TaxID=1657 RepID=A0A0K9EVB9_9ACTO|nr:ABC transporter ATP-binding protein [Actinobaculum suis]KMY24063.1 heme ABC transporter ATP-binding protein [Actinobaculum suis]MDY5154004.1 ABC transporter ATP-binding protein [Actinobaculum suis]SDE03064.1 simple sugar transport system ATP-binding protein [Actinobaculum suis]VDG76849.1 sugar ABC transporter ATP-binding protein [Actinobaculum suis]
MKLELRGITKKFGSLIANDHIDLTVEPGQIHALLGENGAGKSTLMNVLYGLYKPDAGQILLDGEEQNFSSAGDAVAAGIGMVHQHFMLVPVFTVAESVALGYEPMGKAGLISFKQAARQVRELSAKFGYDIDPNAKIEDLPVGVQQRVEILKALSRKAEILVLDEPTAVLTPKETDELMEIMRQLAAGGTSIIFITHKLREVQEVADKITVIRRGKVVGEASPTSTQAELATMMVGRPVILNIDKKPAEPKEGGLEVSDVSLLADDGSVALDHVSFNVRPGEILGIAGVQGNGQTELAEVLLGSRKPDEGTVSVDGRNVGGESVRRRLDSGLGYIPEDRLADGMIGSFSVAENMVLSKYRVAPYSRGPVLRRDVVIEHAKQLAEQYDVRLSSVNDPISTLSGGNQQKVVVARELSQDLELLVANQPTRGVDVGSVEFIHRRIVSARDAGVPVVLISSELDEIYSLADRIAVFYRGRVIGIVPPDTPRQELGLMMAGFSKEQEGESE